MCTCVYMGMCVHVLQAPAPLVEEHVHKRVCMHTCTCLTAKVNGEKKGNMQLRVQANSRILLCYFTEKTTVMDAFICRIIRPNVVKLYFYACYTYDSSNVMVGHAL